MWGYWCVPLSASTFLVIHNICNLQYSRITLTRYTTCYFLLATAACLVQVFLQAATFSDNTKSLQIMSNILAEANVPPGFPIIQDNTLRLCDSIPGQAGTHCIVVSGPASQIFSFEHPKAEITEIGQEQATSSVAVRPSLIQPFTCPKGHGTEFFGENVFWPFWEFTKCHHFWWKFRAADSQWKMCSFADLAGLHVSFKRQITSRADVPQPSRWEKRGCCYVDLPGLASGAIRCDDSERINPPFVCFFLLEVKFHIWRFHWQLVLAQVCCFSQPYSGHCLGGISDIFHYSIEVIVPEVCSARFLQRFGRRQDVMGCKDVERSQCSPCLWPGFMKSDLNLSYIDCRCHYQWYHVLGRFVPFLEPIPGTLLPPIFDSHSCISQFYKVQTVKRIGTSTRVNTAYTVSRYTWFSILFLQPFGLVRPCHFCELTTRRLLHPCLHGIVDIQSVI